MIRFVVANVHTLSVRTLLIRLSMGFSPFWRVILSMYPPCRQREISYPPFTSCVRAYVCFENPSIFLLWKYSFLFSWSYFLLSEFLRWGEWCLNMRQRTFYVCCYCWLFWSVTTRCCFELLCSASLLQGHKGHVPLY